MEISKLNAGLFSSNKDDWETPQELFNNLNAVFNITLDPCSTHENAKCEKHFTVQEDGLKQDWGGETVFCNPPYGKKIKDWVRKCYEEQKHADIVLLIPARTDTSYFHEYIYKKAEIEFIKGRLRFEQNGVPGDSAPFPSMLVYFKNKEKGEQQ